MEVCDIIDFDGRGKKIKRCLHFSKKLEQYKQ